MRALRLVVWVALAVACVFAEEDEKDMEPVSWIGGETVDPVTGDVHFNGLATRATMHELWTIVVMPKLKPMSKTSCAKLDMRRQIGQKNHHVLTPFPPNEPADPQSPDKIQSAVDLCIDHLNSVWILDVGAIYPPKNEDERTPHICPPKVLALDVATGKVRHQVNLLPHVGPMSRLQFITVDYDQSGHAFVYVSDAGTKALIVYDVDQDKCQRVQLPDDVISDYAPRDVLYTILIRNATGENKLYFTYRSGESLWCINTQDLRKDYSMSKATIVGKKEHNMILLGSDDWNAFYFKFAHSSEIYKWNTETSFDEKNFVCVHKTHSELTPTHAVADYKNGVMRLCFGNLAEYLKPDTQTKDAVNSLDVMAVSDDLSASQPLEHQGMSREL